jgi:hypothetical protein
MMANPKTATVMQAYGNAPDPKFPAGAKTKKISPYDTSGITRPPGPFGNLLEFSKRPSRDGPPPTVGAYVGPDGSTKPFKRPGPPGSPYEGRNPRAPAPTIKTPSPVTQKFNRWMQVSKGGRALQGVGRRAKRLNQTIVNLPSPGGIAGVTIAIIAVLLAVVPVQGTGENRLATAADVLELKRALPLPPDKRPQSIAAVASAVAAQEVAWENAITSIPGNIANAATSAIGNALGNNVQADITGLQTGINQGILSGLGFGGLG